MTAQLSGGQEGRSIVEARWEGLANIDDCREISESCRAMAGRRVSTRSWRGVLLSNAMATRESILRSKGRLKEGE